MCGIAGIVGPKAIEYRRSMDGMLDALAHRGPDGAHSYSAPSGNCLLGHTRLAIIDTSQASDQPFFVDPHQAMVYNGECYNFRELKSELESLGHHFKTTGDTEIVFHLISAERELSLSKMNAMFAIGLWNDRDQELFLARDYYGQKPLYYAIVNNLLVFASEIRSILASGLVGKDISRDALRSYLSYGSVQPPQTIIDGINVLPPGRFAKWSPGLGTLASLPWPRPSAEENQSLQGSFLQAVKRHLISDVPLSIFLSGGIDSSAILAAARKCTSANLTSVSVVFPDNAAYSEAEHSRKVAALYESEHREVPFGDAEILQMLPSMLESMDQPTADGINTFIVSAAARTAGSTVALSGLGGDEIFGGYSSFRDVPKILRMYKRMPPGAGRALEIASSFAPYDRQLAKLLEALQCKKDVVGALLSRRRMFTSQQLKTLLGLELSQWCSGLTEERLRELEDKTRLVAEGDAISALEMDLYMGPMLLRDSDNMGMAHSLEIRVPFLDLQFSTQALSLPPADRLRNAVPKQCFQEAISGWLPESVTNRAKQGFVLPLEKWMLGPLRAQVEEKLYDCRSLFGMDESQVKRLWQGFQEKPGRVGWVRPWMLFVLSSYVQLHGLRVDNDASRTVAVANQSQ